MSPTSIPSVLANHGIGKKWQLFQGKRIESEKSILESKMDDDSPLKVAVQRAWNLHLATHDDVDAADPRRCSLERYLSGNGKLVKAIQKN